MRSQDLESSQDPATRYRLVLIGELPLETQVMLLRLLQECELERLGGTETLKVDVPFICAHANARRWKRPRARQAKASRA